MYMKILRIAILIAAAGFLTVACRNVNVQSAGDGTASSVFEGQVDYTAHFSGERLRVDLILAGDCSHQAAYLKEMHREEEWAGSPNALIDKFGYGNYFFELFENEELIYSKGFSTLFDEWTTTEQAKTTPMATGQSLWMPFPRNRVHLVVYQRVRASGRFSVMLEIDIDPEDRHIIPGCDNGFNIKALQYKGDIAHKVDLVLAGEGYTYDEIGKLRSDALRMTDYIFGMEPYSERRNDFNIWLVESVSTDSGADIPQDGVWRNTLMGSMFDTFYIDRYLTVMDHTKIASVVAGAPVDAVIVLVNDSKYGGAGMYGSYAMTTTDNKRSLPVIIHEFGHSFAGLADEYYDSETAYEDFYPLDIEPWEPNITTNVRFEDKWADMIEGGTPIPTPNDSSWMGTTGMFEGAGYMTYGCYRPFYDCRMITNTAPAFCPVCQRAINRMIDYYVK